MGAPVTGEMLEWLKTLCGDWSSANGLDALWSTEWAGSQWTGATNRHAATLLRGPTTAPVFEHAPKILGPLKDAVWEALDFPAFEAWAMRQNGRCPDCGGIGFEPSDVSGFDAEGNGPIEGLWTSCGCRFSRRGGVAFGVPVDRFLVLRYLGPLSGTDVQIATVGKVTLSLRSAEWMVVIMGLRDGVGEAFP